MPTVSTPRIASMADSALVSDTTRLAVGVLTTSFSPGMRMRSIVIGSSVGSWIGESAEWNSTEPPMRTPLLAIVE